MKKHSIAVLDHLHATHDKDNPALQKIIVGRLKRLGRDKSLHSMESAIYWPAEFFGLDQSLLFQNASVEQQVTILRGCSRDLLHEAYFIEKSGLAYCAKMVLQAETTEAAQAYSLIGADEATHLQWVSDYVSPAWRTRPEGDFLRFLTTLIDAGDPNSLAYLLQVILEGWGLQHYKSLAASCLDPHLQTIWLDIVRDEALHQQTGTVLFRPERLTTQEETFLLDALAHFLEMVRVGPIAVVAQVESALGHLNAQQKSQLIQHISGQSKTAKKLSLLRELMGVSGCERFVAALDARNLYVPV